MATSEIYGARGTPIDIPTFTDDIQQVLHGVGGRIIGNVIKTESAKMYTCTLIQHININEDGSERQKLRTRTGLIKVLGLIHKRERQSNPMLAWSMFHKIYRMYSDISNK